MSSGLSARPDPIWAASWPSSEAQMPSSPCRCSAIASEAAEIRQPEVEQDEVGRRLEDVPQRGHGAGRGGDRMSVLGEHPDQRGADRRVVFHKQKLCHETKVARLPATPPFTGDLVITALTPA